VKFYELSPSCGDSHVSVAPAQQSGIRPWVVSPHRRARFTEAPFREVEESLTDPPPGQGGPLPLGSRSHSSRDLPPSWDATDGVGLLQPRDHESLLGHVPWCHVISLPGPRLGMAWVTYLREGRPSQSRPGPHPPWNPPPERSISGWGRGVCQVNLRLQG